MSEKHYWEEVEIGTEIKPLVKVATTQMLVKWAGASGDFNPLHFDSIYAESIGVGKIIIHGALKRQWLIQLLTDWVGEQGILRKFSCQYGAMDYPRHMKTITKPDEGETWICKGQVTKKYVEGDQHFIDCKIWLENGKGETTTHGRATVILPAKSA